MGLGTFQTAKSGRSSRWRIASRSNGQAKSAASGLAGTSLRVKLKQPTPAYQTAENRNLSPDAVRSEAPA
jgi:hypothetical protein